MKNLKKLTARFYFASLMKALTAIVTIIFIGKSTIVGLSGIVALLYFAYEQYEEYKRLISQ